MKTLGELIKNYRKEQGLSLRDFEALCGISHSYIAKLEKGIDRRTGNPIEPTLDLVEKIAKAMGLSLDSILRAIGKIDAPDNSNQYENIETAQGLLFKNNNVVSNKSEVLSQKDEKDVQKRMQKIKDDLLSGPEGLMFAGEPMSPEAVESVLSALEFGITQAKLLNKKFTPKKYRK